MQVQPHEVKVDEKALEFAMAFSPQREFVRQYIAVVLGYPLPADLLETLAQSRGISRDDAYAIITGFADALFLNSRVQH